MRGGGNTYWRKHMMAGIPRGIPAICCLRSAPADQCRCDLELSDRYLYAPTRKAHRMFGNRAAAVWRGGVGKFITQNELLQYYCYLHQDQSLQQYSSPVPLYLLYSQMHPHTCHLFLHQQQFLYPVSEPVLL